MILKADSVRLSLAHTWDTIICKRTFWSLSRNKEALSESDRCEGIKSRVTSVYRAVICGLMLPWKVSWRSGVSAKVNRTIELISVTFIPGSSPACQFADDRVSGEVEEGDLLLFNGWVICQRLWCMTQSMENWEIENNMPSENVNVYILFERYLYTTLFASFLTLRGIHGQVCDIVERRHVRFLKGIIWEARD